MNRIQFVVAIIVFTFILIAIPLTMVLMKGNNHVEVDSRSLADARRKHTTKLEKRGSAPQEYVNSTPANAKLITYKSGKLQLKAYLYIPKTKGKHKTILFAHGGFALSPEDFQAMTPFVNSNCVVMAPAVRGENGNPGDFELCFGEVDDLKAAVDYLWKLPQVDRKNIFALGHSVGGTNVVLLSEIDSRLKKVAACGAYADFDRGGYYEQIRPYERVGKEHQVRSFGLWVSDLHCPVLLCFGGNDPVEKAYSVQAQDMQKEATQHNKRVEVEIIPGYDHFQAFVPSLNKIVPFFETN